MEKNFDEWNMHETLTVKFVELIRRNIKRKKLTGKILKNLSPFVKFVKVSTVKFLCYTVANYCTMA